MSSRIKTDVKKLFEFWCEVKRAHGIDRTTRIGANAPSGIITESFPENFRDSKTIADVTTFAYPCDFESDSVQSYSFVLTTDDSKWRFGFCRHDPKTNSAMVIITFLPWHDTFLRLLAVLAELRRNNNGDFQTFLTEAYNRGVPDPGGNLKLFYRGGTSHFVFERPEQFQLPSIPENYNLNMYYNFADPKNMISVFAAMLAERRIIFTSRRLDRLSSCIQAANAFLYPMVWQHIFIPVLPMKLKDYLSAPMPYLIGVPEMVLETMTPDELGEVVTLNCDTKIFDSPFDDVHDMPTEIVSQLKKQLSQYHEHIGDRVSKIFLGVLVQLIGGYRDAVEFRDSGKTFSREKFIESRPSHLRPFLTKMMELQIFQQFIDERLEMLNTGLGVSDEFETETVRYADKMKKRGRNYAFLKNVKDKTNPAVKSAVKSVKEGSRGVKTAYKDLKSKLRDITPPNNTHFRSHLSSNSQHDRIDGFVISKTHRAGHHSAPSSPIFSKRSGLANTIAVGFQYASPEAISGASHASRRPNPLAMSNSIAHVQSNNYANGSLSANHHNNHLGASPTVSPASSICSSEMNLSQELQNHPLFKTPTVDRSLKPSSSLELNCRSRIGGPPPARPPLPSLHALQQKLSLNRVVKPLATPSYYNHPYASQENSKTPGGLRHFHAVAKPTMGARLPLQSSLLSSASSSTSTSASASASSLSSSSANKERTKTKNQRVPINGMMACVTTQNTNSHPSVTGKIITTDSIYDTPPDMQSPPVPPRRQCTHNAATLPPNIISTATLKAQTLEINRCWPEYTERNGLLLNDTLRSSSLSNVSASSASSSTNSNSNSNSSASFASALSSISQQPCSNNPVISVPVPAPRLRREKESLRSLQPNHSQMGAGASLNSVPSCSSQEDTMNDLISLDDSNNASFDLEDFDPLNQNARPLPLGGSVVARKSGTLPASASATQMTATPAVSNPIYPYFTPQHGRTIKQQPMPMEAPPLPTSLPPPMPPPDEDFELLRKYGLDQFTLTTPNSGIIVAGKRNGTPINSVPMATTGMSNWTTFD